MKIYQAIYKYFNNKSGIIGVNTIQSTSLEELLAELKLYAKHQKSELCHVRDIVPMKVVQKMDDSKNSCVPLYIYKFYFNPNDSIEIKIQVINIV